MGFVIELMLKGKNTPTQISNPSLKEYPLPEEEEEERRRRWGRDSFIWKDVKCMEFIRKTKTSN
jgi:hypothetical protein